MTLQVGIALVIGLAASIDDLSRRRIANWIPLAALASGIAWQTAAGGWRGAISAVLGAAAGFAVFLVFYVLGGMGGGDVKLMAGFGALIGIEHLAAAALWSAACGAFLAVGALGVRWLSRRLSRTEASASPQSDSIPYAPAIALGVWLSLLGA